MNKYLLLPTGYILAKIISSNIKSIIIKDIHLHHWILACVPLLLNKNLSNNKKYFLYGIIIQGLSYPDAFNFKVK